MTPTRKRIAVVLGVALACAPACRREVESPESIMARRFESLRSQPDALLAFLRDMPKGGDLHNHLVGAIYAESLAAWAADERLCVARATSALSSPPCDPAQGRRPVTDAVKDPAMYRAMIDAWSMRGGAPAAGLGHDHFFAAFDKFMPATAGRLGSMLAEAASRAAADHVSYLELMITPDDGLAGQAAQQAGWRGDLAATAAKLEGGGLAPADKKVRDAVRDGEAERDRLLKCGTPQAAPGCAVTMRYLYQALRALPLPAVFAQLVLGFRLASDPGSGFVGVNLVQAEDNPSALKNFDAEMQMFKFLRPRYPRAHLSLHAGELVPALEGTAASTRSHIRDSVEIAGADRIGHGVDILDEPNPDQLLGEMAQRHVLVEICLTSNAVILGVSGVAHPLAAYLSHGVPVALATDDEGVERTDMTHQYLLAATDQKLGYLALKNMARASLEYAFVEADTKARLRSDLDRAFTEFESRAAR